MKNQKGITLIALVITIIVLLILAGVSIAMLAGQNGVLTQATKSKSETLNAEAAERINMALNAAKTDLLAADATGKSLTASEVKSSIVSEFDGLTGYNVAFDNDATPTKIKITPPAGVTLTSEEQSISLTSPYTIIPAKSK